MIEKQSKNKVLLLIIGVLLISNIVFLTFFLMKDSKPAPRPDRKEYISNFLKKEIGFNATQLAQYDTLSNRHKDEIKTQFDKIRTRRSDQFKELVAGKFTDSTINVLSDRSAMAQKDMEVLILVHLREIRALCAPDQLTKFDSLFYKVLIRKREPEKK